MVGKGGTGAPSLWPSGPLHPTRLRAHDQYIVTTLIGGKGWSRCSFLAVSTWAAGPLRLHMVEATWSLTVGRWVGGLLEPAELSASKFQSTSPCLVPFQMINLDHQAHNFWQGLRPRLVDSSLVSERVSTPPELTSGPPP